MMGLFDLLPSTTAGDLSLVAVKITQLALAGLALSSLYKIRAVFTIQRPKHGSSMWGVVVIPEAERWSLCNARGELSTLVGPKLVRVFGARLLQLKEFSATHAEYLRVEFVDGRTEIVAGPAVVYMDQAVHKLVKVQRAVNLTDHEVLVLYREEEDIPEDSGSATKKEGAAEKTPPAVAPSTTAEEKKPVGSAPERKVVRALVRGPCLHVPKNASEWTHEFCWHGSHAAGDHDGGAPARKFRGALKFQKLRTCPDQTYYDVEGVRTRDDALVAVKLMIFYRLQDIDTMLRETHDPVADFINAVSSDVIDFVAGKTFEEFKGATDELNELKVYQQLTTRAKGIGFEVTKVVFRGYGAPTRLQKMHDDAIERRTKLCLERETEDQEQSLLDMKLEREEERLRTRRRMEQEAKAHERELQRKAHEALQEERRAERLSHREHLNTLHRELGITGDALAHYLLAVEQGPPAKLIQINGNGKEAGSNGAASSNGFVHLEGES